VELVTIKAALERSQIIILLVDHWEFKQMQTEDLRGKTIIDTRGIWKEK